MGHSISYAIRMCCRAEIDFFWLRLIFLPHWPNSKNLVSPKKFQMSTIKGIVSRDWGGLETILLDRLEVFNVLASGLVLFL